MAPLGPHLIASANGAPPLPQVRTMHALDHRNILRFYAW
jgi:hypothetical protein